MQLSVSGVPNTTPLSVNVLEEMRVTGRPLKEITLVPSKQESIISNEQGNKGEMMIITD